MLVAKKDEPETPAVTPAAEEELMEEPETTPAPRSSGITVYGPTFFPALSRVPKRTLAVAGIAILCLILTAAVLIGLVHLPSPSFLQDIGTPTGTTPAIVAPDPSDATTRTTPQGVAPASPSLVPGPTQVLPESYRIWLQADRDPITSMVTVIYNGGKGQRAVREIQVRLTRSDGQVLTQVFRPLTTGEGAELQGTKYTDRLEVNITYNNGDSFTVIDRIFPYKQRN